MKLYKKGDQVYIEHQGVFYASQMDWDALVNRPHLYQYLLKHLLDCNRIDTIDEQGEWDPPMGTQELWAAGVTYLRSKEARE
ncbi:MAG: hypothetical protein RLZ76_1679, partial [Bacteroidota bacterium]